MGRCRRLHRSMLRSAHGRERARCAVADVPAGAPRRHPRLVRRSRTEPPVPWHHAIPTRSSCRRSWPSRRRSRASPRPGPRSWRRSRRRRSRRRLAGRRPAGMARDGLQPAGAQPLAGGADRRRGARRPAAVGRRGAASGCPGSGRTRRGPSRRSRSARRSARSTRTSGGCSVGPSAVRSTRSRAARAPGHRRRRRSRRIGRPTGPTPLMDVGATFCRTARPRCADCPAAVAGAATRLSSSARPRAGATATTQAARRRRRSPPPRAGSAAGSSIASGTPRGRLGRRSTAPIGDHDGVADRAALDALAARGPARASPDAIRCSARLPIA